MTGNHLMLLLFRSICLDSRCRVNQWCLIGNPVNIRIYCLTLFVSRVRVCALTAHNEGVASESSCELDHIRILLDPVINVHQRRSVLRLCPFHESRHVYPAVVGLHLQLKVRPIWTRYCTGLVPAFRVCVEYVFSRKENTSANWPCLNKALLSSFTELCNFRKCLCHSNDKFKS